MNKTATLKRVITICSIIAIVIMAGTMIITSAYTVFAADDYTHADSVGALHVSFFSYLLASIRYSKNMWLTWQGTYFSMFIQAFLSPINNFGMPQLRVEMVLNSVCLFASVILFIFTVFRKLDKENSYVKWLITALVIFVITNFSVYTEIYLWFSGATSYSIPLTMLMFGLTFYLKMDDSDAKKYPILSGIFGFIAMGGSLTIAGMGCYAVFLICIYRCLRDKKLINKSSIVFAVYFLGALFNTVAPGNFRRQGIVLDLYGQVTYTGIRPIDAVIVSMDTASQQIITNVKNTNFLFILVLTFLVSYMMKREKAQIDFNRVVISVCGLLTAFVTLFPYCLANLSSKMQNRVDFIVTIAIVLSFMNLAFVLGETVRALTEEHVVAVSALLAVFAMFIWLGDGYGFLNYQERNVMTSLLKHEYQNYYQANEEFVARLDTYEKGTDVLIYSEEGEFPVPITYTFNFYLYDNVESGVNKAIANIYDFNSIALGWR